MISNGGDIFMKKFQISEYTISILTLSAVFLMLSQPQTLIDSISSSIKMCAFKIVPSLFPFMVMSSLIIRTGGAVFLGKIFERPFKFIFKISGVSASAVILGSMCGFPVGAKCACELYLNGYINKNEAERLISFCNNTSPAFLIGTVGVSLWKNAAFGIMLYFIQIFCAFSVGIIWGFINKNSPKNSDDFNITNDKPKVQSFPSALSSAIHDSSLNIVSVCGFIIFFSVIIDLIIQKFYFVLSDNMISTICVFFEFSRACFTASSSNNYIFASLITAFAIGWSGLSVHFQVASILNVTGLSMKFYIYGKILCGILCAIFTALVMIFTDFSLKINMASISTIGGTNYHDYNILTLVITAIEITIILASFLLKNKSKSLEK